MRAARLSLALLLLTACTHEVQSEPLGAVDVDGYGRELQGVLEPSCATLDCHGVAGRPVRLYSETGLRAPGVDRDSSVTPEELRANALSLAGVDPDAEPGSHLAVTKPLAEAAGGEHHVGGDIWPDRNDPAVECLVAWLAGEVASAAGACATAREAVALPPP